jgi:hypothetical protein
LGSAAWRLQQGSPILVGTSYTSFLDSEHQYPRFQYSNEYIARLGRSMDLSTMAATNNDTDDQESPHDSFVQSPSQRNHDCVVDASSADGEHVVLPDESHMEGSPNHPSRCVSELTHPCPPPHTLIGSVSRLHRFTTWAISRSVFKRILAIVLFTSACLHPLNSICARLYQCHLTMQICTQGTSKRSRRSF